MILITWRLFPSNIQAAAAPPAVTSKVSVGVLSFCRPFFCLQNGRLPCRLYHQPVRRGRTAAATSAETRDGGRMSPRAAAAMADMVSPRSE